MQKSPAVLFASEGASLPAAVSGWLADRGFPLETVRCTDELMALALRTRPRLVVLDVREESAKAFEACRRIKSDSYTGIVPVVAIANYSEESTGGAFDAGADEVLREDAPGVEVRWRLDLLLRRSDRDVHVHPSTRLPGTVEIEAEIGRRIATTDPFAVCYADLDHFKEFNDRYSYYDGDRVIRILSMILHDVVKGICGRDGFIGHIGGDDFIFVIPAPAVSEVCGEAVEVFDQLIPFQYSEQDRRAGYFFGKDRRGQLHRVPLMTLSIGVVTNERRVFTSAAQVSELATEMKGYAKTLSGSVFTVDRRQDAPAEPTPPRAQPSISSSEER